MGRPGRGPASERNPFAVLGAPLELGLEQGAAELLASGRRRASSHCGESDPCEVDHCWWRQGDRLLVGRVMSPASARGCVSQWIESGCATMLSSR